MKHLRLLTLAGLLALFASPAAAQVLRGRVLDAASGEPIPEARITVLTPEGRTVGRTTAARTGAFDVTLRTHGAVRVRAERTGYRPSLTQSVQVDQRETVEVDVKMAVTALQVEPLTVVARRAPPRRASLEVSGFYAREAAGFGDYLRREDIESKSNVDLAQVIDRMPGTTRIGPVIVFDRSSHSGALIRAQTGKGFHCTPLVYLDGALVNLDRYGLNGIALPEHLEAIETYSSSARIPVQYSGSVASCGVILLWTRKEQ